MSDLSEFSSVPQHSQSTWFVSGTVFGSGEVEREKLSLHSRGSQETVYQ